MQITKISDNKISFKSYEVNVRKATPYFSERQMRNLSHKCDIEVYSGILSFWKNLFKSRNIVNVKVTNFNTGWHYTTRLTESEIKKDHTIITKSAVKLAKKLGCIK